MKKIILPLFLLSFFLVYSSLVYAESITCGVVLPLSGSMASVGTSIKNSMLLASQNLDSNKKVSFLFEDDQYVQKNSISAVVKLIEIQKVQCLVTFGSSPSLAVADIAENAKVPMIAIAITPKVGKNSTYVLRHYIPIERQIEKLLSEVAKRGYQTVAMLTTTTDASISFRDPFVQGFRGKILLNEEILPTDTDFNVIASKVKSLRPDAVFMNLLSPHVALASKALRKVGYKGDFFGSVFLGNKSEISVALGTLSGAWYVHNDDSKAQEYYLQYKEMFHTIPDAEGLNGYDVAKILIEKAGQKNLNDALHAIKNFYGLLGTYSIIGNSFDIQAGIQTVQ